MVFFFFFMDSEFDDQRENNCVVDILLYYHCKTILRQSIIKFYDSFNHIREASIIVSNESLSYNNMHFLLH